MCASAVWLFLPLSLQAPVADEALAERVARSVDLFTQYTGDWPSSLENLIQEPDERPFWPEGGYWEGGFPKEIDWRDGIVRYRKASVRVQLPTLSAIIPPTERLKEFYTTRIRLHLLRFRIESHLRTYGRLPAQEELGNLPVGFSLRFFPNRIHIRSKGSALRLNDLSVEEQRDLDERARIRLSMERRERIEALIDLLRDDDFETRNEASGKLQRMGPFVRDSLIERLERERDPEIREWVGRAARSIPLASPSWRRELGPSSAVVWERWDPEEDERCARNLGHLWSIHIDCARRFGGGRMSSVTGSQFWLELSSASTMLIDESYYEVYQCPLSGEELEGNRCSYYGPASDINGYGNEDPIGMCDEDAHGGRLVLIRKSGTVEWVPRGGPSHESALSKLKK